MNESSAIFILILCLPVFLRIHTKILNFIFDWFFRNVEILCLHVLLFFNSYKITMILNFEILCILFFTEKNYFLYMFKLLYTCIIYVCIIARALYIITYIYLLCLYAYVICFKYAFKQAKWYLHWTFYIYREWFYYLP